MRRIGLKLFSINENYRDLAIELYQKKVYDYIELYTVPDSFDNTIDLWKDVDIPFVIHGPHFRGGMNFALKEKEDNNKKLYEEAARFADELRAKYIIFHPGIAGDIEETARQVRTLADKRILIENKPYHAIANKEMICNGYAPVDIDLVMRESNCGFCLDVGHCFCAANALGVDKIQFLEKFLQLGPKMIHLADNLEDTTVDAHMHIGKGSYDIKEIWGFIPGDIYLTLEVDKDSNSDLNDFVADVETLNKMVALK